jgi:hypothetical protein
VAAVLRKPIPPGRLVPAIARVISTVTFLRGTNADPPLGPIDATCLGPLAVADDQRLN